MKEVEFIEVSTAKDKAILRFHLVEKEDSDDNVVSKPKEEEKGGESHDRPSIK